MLLQLPAKLVTFHFLQPAARRATLLQAWREKLENVETRKAADLVAELRDKNIKPTEAPIDLSERLPPHPQSEREWAAQRAIVEFQLGKRLEFQGTGDTLIRTGEGAKNVDINQLVGQMLQGELQKTLGDLLGAAGQQPANKPGWFEQAAKAADREGVSGCRVTRLQQEIATGRVTVEVHFVARMPQNKWEVISTDKVTLDANQPRKDLQDGIAKDPQVAKAIETVKGLGLPVAEAQIKLALQFGAATMEAQQSAETRFFQRQNRYTRNLDGPPLLWP